MAVFGTVFAGIQAYYAYKQHLQNTVEAADRSRAAAEVANRALVRLSHFMHMKPPLPAAESNETNELREQVAKAQSMGADPILCRELAALIDLLLVRLDTAEGSFSELQRQFPGRVVPYIGLGATSFYRQKYADAERVFADALTRFPGSPELQAQRARALLWDGKIPAARAAAEEALTLNPSDEFAHQQLGLIATLEHRDDDAAAAFSEAARLSPAWYEPHLGLAAIYVTRLAYHDALAQLDLAERAAPDNATTVLAKAAVLQALGSQASADAALTRARELLPVRFLSGYGYAAIAPWHSDLPRLDEFNGDFLLQYQDSHPHWLPEGFGLPLLKAFRGTESVAKFNRFEAALFDICVPPVYHSDGLFGTTQLLRMTNHSPQCLVTSEHVLEVVMTEKALRLPPNEIPNYEMPKPDVNKIKTFEALSARKRQP